MNGIEILMSAVCVHVMCDEFNVTTSSNNFIDDSLDIESASSDIKEQRLAKLRQELNGQVLNVAAMEDFPLSYTSVINGTRIGFGVAFQLLKFLTEKFNFTYNLIAPEKGNFGSTTDMEGSLIQLLNESKADLAASFIPILSDARNYIYYSTTALDEGEWIMIMTRPAESATGSGLLAPFDRDVWLLILISLLSVGPMIYGLIIIRYKLTKENSQKTYPLPHCIWFVYGALMKQGSTLSPIADSTRLLFATWWIFITILTSFYTANLTAFLTLSKFTLPINNVDDIVKKNQLFVAQRGGTVEYAIKNTNESLTNLYKMVQNNRGLFVENADDTQCLREYVKQKGYVYIRDRPAIDHLIYSDYLYRKTISMSDEKIQCPFAIAKTPFLTRKRAFAYPQNTKWNHLFDPELLHLVESGIIKYMISEDLPNAEICPQNLGGTERQLRNGDLLMTYIIMIAGFCTSIVIFTTEIIFKCLNNKRNPAATQNLDTKKKKFQTIPSPPPSYTTIFSPSNNDNNNNNKNKGGGPAAGSINNYPNSTIIGSNSWLPKKSPNNNHNNINTIAKNNNNNNNTDGTYQYINGRQYMVIKGFDGSRRLIPLRTPSATLFQYSYTQ